MHIKAQGFSGYQDTNMCCFFSKDVLLLTLSHVFQCRPYLVGTGGGGLDLVELDGPIAKVRITGPAANVMTVRVAVTQKLRERIPAIAAVQLVN